MAQRRFHYEQAFEHYLRANRVPYVAVDEAKKALLPAASARQATNASIKSFDFVVYTPGRNMIIDVKGRMYGSSRNRSTSASSISNRRYESWVTQDDVDGLRHWQDLFGREFEAIFVFAYCLRQQPPDALFEEVLTHGGRWYALREVRLEDYCREMTARSSSWGTVHVPGEAFRRISRPFSARSPASPRRHPSDSPSRAGRRA